MNEILDASAATTSSSTTATVAITSSSSSLSSSSTATTTSSTSTTSPSEPDFARLFGNLHALLDVYPPGKRLAGACHTTSLSIDSLFHFRVLVVVAVRLSCAALCDEYGLSAARVDELLAELCSGVHGDMQTCLAMLDSDDHTRRLSTGCSLM